jgi:type I restriction enzyme R subunit
VHAALAESKVVAHVTSPVDNWRAKEATQNVMRQTIYDFLFSDETGLPGSYSPQEIAQKTQLVFGHIYTAMV